MHEYGIDAKRTKIFFYLSLFAILCASAASHLLHDLPFATITIPVTSFTIFLLLLRIFSSVLWKRKRWHTLGIVKTPNLAGVWHGSYTTSTQQTHQLTLEVSQTWTKIKLMLTSEQYLAVSYMAAMKTTDPLGVKLIVHAHLFEQVTEQMPKKCNTIVFELVQTKPNTLYGRFYTAPHAFSAFGTLALKKGESAS